MRYVISAEKRTCGARPAGDVDAAFERDLNAVKRAERLVLEDGGFRGSGLRSSAVRIQMNEGIQLGLKGCDAAKMGFDKFRGGNFLGADASGSFRDGGKGREVDHKRECESIRACDAGQARSDAWNKFQTGTEDKIS